MRCCERLRGGRSFFRSSGERADEPHDVGHGRAARLVEKAARRSVPVVRSDDTDQRRCTAEDHASAAFEAFGCSGRALANGSVLCEIEALLHNATRRQTCRALVRRRCLAKCARGSKRRYRPTYLNSGISFFGSIQKASVTHSARALTTRSVICEMEALLRNAARRQIAFQK